MKFMGIEGKWVTANDVSQVKVGDHVKYQGVHSRIIHGGTEIDCRQVVYVEGDKAKTSGTANIFNQKHFKNVKVFVPSKKKEAKK